MINLGSFNKTNFNCSQTNSWILSVQVITFGRKVGKFRISYRRRLFPQLLMSFSIIFFDMFRTIIILKMFEGKESKKLFYAILALIDEHTGYCC